MSEAPIYVSVKDASKIVGIGKDAMYKMIHQQGFPCVKVGNKYLVRRSGLEEWFKEREGREIVID